LWRWGKRRYDARKKKRPARKRRVAIRYWRIGFDCIVIYLILSIKNTNMLKIIDGLRGIKTILSKIYFQQDH